MLRLRQVALVAHDLDAAVAALTDRLGLEVAYRDPGVAEFGLVNAVLPVGDTFLEVVSPTAPGTAAGRHLERRGGDGGYMVLVQVPDTGPARRRVADLGIRVVWQVDLPDITGTHLHPRDVGGAILSLDCPDPPGSWRWAGPNWAEDRGEGRARELAAAELQGDDPEALARRWGAVLDRPPQPAGGAWEIALDRGRLRFVVATDGRGEGLGAVDIAVPPGQPTGEVELVGTRFCLVESP